MSGGRQLSKPSKRSKAGLSEVIKKRATIVFDDKDKASVRQGVIVDVTDKFLFIETKPRERSVIEVIPLSRVIRIEVGEEQ